MHALGVHFFLHESSFLCIKMGQGGIFVQAMVLEILGEFGSWGVFLLIAVENLFPPIPSEVILTFAGFLTSCTSMTVPEVIVAATGGSVAGAIVLYGLGKLLSPVRLNALLSGPVARRLKLEQEDVQKAADWFSDHGWPSVFYCRCIPILRSLISIPAGMAGMRFLPFLLTTGSLLWNILLVGLGALAGENWPMITGALAQVSDGVKWFLAAAAIGAVVWRKTRKRRIDCDRPSGVQ